MFYFGDTYMTNFTIHITNQATQDTFEFQTIDSAKEFIENMCKHDYLINLGVHRLEIFSTDWRVTEKLLNQYYLRRYN